MKKALSTRSLPGLRTDYNRNVSTVPTRFNSSLTPIDIQDDPPPVFKSEILKTCEIHGRKYELTKSCSLCSMSKSGCCGSCGSMMLKSPTGGEMMCSNEKCAPVKKGYDYDQNKLDIMKSSLDFINLSKGFKDGVLDFLDNGEFKGKQAEIPYNKPSALPPQRNWGKIAGNAALGAAALGSIGTIGAGLATANPDQAQPTIQDVGPTNQNHTAGYFPQKNPMAYPAQESKVSAPKIQAPSSDTGFKQPQNDFGKSSILDLLFKK